MVNQQPLTIVTPVDAHRSGQLAFLLARVQLPDIESNALVPFYKIKSLHFARFVMVDAVTKGYPAQPVFSTDFDGEEKAHLEELIREAKQGLPKFIHVVPALPATWKLTGRSIRYRRRLFTTGTRVWKSGKYNSRRSLEPRS